MRQSKRRKRCKARRRERAAESVKLLFQWAPWCVVYWFGPRTPKSIKPSWEPPEHKNRQCAHIARQMIQADPWLADYEPAMEIQRHERLIQDARQALDAARASGDASGAMDALAHLDYYRSCLNWHKQQLRTQ